MAKTFREFKIENMNYFILFLLALRNYIIFFMNFVNYNYKTNSLRQ